MLRGNIEPHAWEAMGCQCSCTDGVCGTVLSTCRLRTACGFHLQQVHKRRCLASNRTAVSGWPAYLRFGQYGSHFFLSSCREKDALGVRSSGTVSVVLDHALETLTMSDRGIQSPYRSHPCPCHYLLAAIQDVLLRQHCTPVLLVN